MARILYLDDLYLYRLSRVLLCGTVRGTAQSAHLSFTCHSLLF